MAVELDRQKELLRQATEEVEAQKKRSKGFHSNYPAICRFRYMSRSSVDR